MSWWHAASKLPTELCLSLVALEQPELEAALDVHHQQHLLYRNSQHLVLGGHESIHIFYMQWPEGQRQEEQPASPAHAIHNLHRQVRQMSKQVGIAFSKSIYLVKMQIHREIIKLSVCTNEIVLIDSVHTRTFVLKIICLRYFDPVNFNLTVKTKTFRGDLPKISAE